MGARCCGADHDRHPTKREDASYRRVLWAVLGINSAMFAVEIGAGVASGSASLQADALDFLGDAGNYAISLFVVGMALRYRALAALCKGATMGLFAAWVIGIAVWNTVYGTRREPLQLVQSALRPCFRTLLHLVCCGPTGAAMRICALRGFAPATTYSATLLSWLPPPASLEPAPAGLTQLSLASWQRWLFKVQLLSPASRSPS